MAVCYNQKTGGAMEMIASETYIPTPLDTIPRDVPLPFPIHIRVAGKFILFRNLNDTLTNERVSSLNEKVDAVFIPETSWLAFLDYLDDVCEIAVEDPDTAAKNMHALLVAYGRHLEQMKVVERETIAKLRRLGYRLATLTKEHPNVTAKLLKRYKETSVYFSSHSANVAVYSTAIAHKLNMPIAEVEQLAFACLVHNIGNSLVPTGLLYKEGKLTEEEWRVVRAHSYQGAQLLEYMDAPTEVVLTAKQHHEHMDGKGYPLNLTGPEIHPFARICSIADVYDALTSRKPYGNKQPLEPDGALSEMRGMQGKFDPDILDMFGNS